MLSSAQRVLAYSRASEDPLGAIYWGIRAYGAHFPNQFKENLQKYLEDARTACLKLKEKTEYSEVMTDCFQLWRCDDY